MSNKKYNEMDSYQEYIGMSRYARFIDDKHRRETWPETVQRFVDYIFSRTPAIQDNTELKKEIFDSIHNLDLMPSMRAMMTAGKSADRDNTCIYNCSYLPVDDAKSFDEAMFILLCGTGVGFSVESKYTTPKKVGQNHYVCLSPTSIQAKYLSGTSLPSDLPELDLKHLVEELPGQNHQLIYFNLL